jgi:hypothetical protein
MGYKDKEKRKEYARKWVAARRKEWFDKHGPCIDCGSWENLELDHIDPKKKITHKVWSWSAERRKEETDKCVARCEKCHLARTKVQLRELMTKETIHGTSSAYYNKKCRCIACKLYHKVERRERYLRLGT